MRALAFLRLSASLPPCAHTHLLSFRFSPFFLNLRLRACGGAARRTSAPALATLGSHRMSLLLPSLRAPATVFCAVQSEGETDALNAVNSAEASSRQRRRSSHAVSFSRVPLFCFLEFGRWGRIPAQGGGEKLGDSLLRLEKEAVVPIQLWLCGFSTGNAPKRRFPPCAFKVFPLLSCPRFLGEEPPLRLAVGLAACGLRAR